MGSASARSQSPRGPEGGTGHGPRAPQALREAELPVRHQRGSARVDRAQLQRSGQDEVPDAPGGGGGSSTGGDGALPLRQSAPGGRGQRRPGRACRTATPPGQGALSRGAGQPGEPSSQDAFAASEAQFAKVRTFLSGGAAAGLQHFQLEEYIKTEGFELLRLLLQGHFDLRSLQEGTPGGGGRRQRRPP
jgi:hypothetical protein